METTQVLANDMEVQSNPSGETPPLLKNKPFILLLLAYTFAIFGNSFHNIALNLWVLTETGSAKMMTVILVVNLAVGSLLGPIAGTMVDRLNRRMIMLVCDSLRCLIVLAIAICIALPHIPFILIVFLTALVTMLGLFQSPALNASLINIVGKAHIQRATGLMNVSDNISRTIGFAAGGIFVAAFGGAWAIVIDSFTFFLSFILVLLAGHFPSPIRKRDEVKTNFLQDVWGGFKYVKQHPFAKAVTILSPTLLLFFVSSLMLIQVMAVTIWQANPFEFGLIEACIPLGYMLGAGIIVGLGSRLKRRGKLIMFSLLTIGPAYVYLSFSSSASYAIPIILLIGFLFSFCTLLITIILRLEVSQELQGRVFGILGSLNSVVPSLGLIVASFFADLYGADTILLYSGAALTILAFILFYTLVEIKRYN